MDMTHRPLRLLVLLATLSSLLSAALGIRWLLVPDDAVYTLMPTPPPLLDLLGPGPMYGAQIVIALLGAVMGAALLATRTAAGRTALTPAVPDHMARLATTVGLAQVGLFGLGFGSMSTLMVTGYLVALTVPVIVVVCGVLLVRSGPVGHRALGAAILLAVVLGAVLGRDVLGQLATTMFPLLLAETREILTVGHMVLAGAVWAVLAVLALRGTGTVARIETWVTLHRRALTLIAACGPLPYALTRLTWLTPWPQLGGERAAADPSVLVWGLALSSGAWLAVVLTIGLIRPWGEIFPGWFPVVGGRRVPIAAAAIPGLTVAALLSFVAVPMVLGAGSMGLGAMLTFALVFPCWFWGPALALAVWGYIGHRRSTIGSRHAPDSSARMGV